MIGKLIGEFYRRKRLNLKNQKINNFLSKTAEH